MSVVAPEPTDERDRRDPGEARAGVFLARLTVAPALLLVSWLAVALPLLMAGVFTPLPAVALFVPVAAAVLTFGLRAVRPPEARWGTWWAVGGLLAVIVAFCVLQLLTFSEQIVVRRDPASYFNFATWLASTTGRCRSARPWPRSAARTPRCRSAAPRSTSAAACCGRSSWRARR